MDTVTQKTCCRQALILWAQKQGVTPAVRRCNVSRQLVYHWMKRYDGILDSLKDRSYKPHDTRHTCISMLTEKEVSPTLIKKIAGHSGAMTLTERIYTHINVRELLGAINKI